MSKIHYRPPNFTRTQLRKILRYEPSTGIWYRLLVQHHLGVVGEVAGCRNKSDGRVMPDGLTVGKHVKPMVAAWYAGGTMRPLLPPPSKEVSQ